MLSWCLSFLRGRAKDHLQQSSGVLVQNVDLLTPIPGDGRVSMADFGSNICVASHVEMSASHSFGSSNTSITCYIKKGVLRAANLPVEVE